MTYQALKATAACLALSFFIFSFGSCSDNSAKKDNSEDLKNVSQMPPAVTHEKEYIVVDSTLLATTKDVVCGMTIKNKIVDTTFYKAKIYGFCGAGCKESFIAEPLTYLNPVK